MDNKNNTYNEIIRCARTLIINGGYNGFSYADIAEIVGIRKASIHHHFPTKADLVRILLETYRTQARSGIELLEQHVTDPVRQLHAYVDYWRKCIADDQEPFCVCALLATQVPQLPEEIVKEIQKHFEFLLNWLASVLERGAEQKKISFDGKASAEAESFLATIHGAMLSARAYGGVQTFNLITTLLLKRLTSL